MGKKEFKNFEKFAFIASESTNKFVDKSANFSTLFLNLLSLTAIISLILLIYSGSILYAAFDETFYHKEFEKLGVYSALKGYDIISINQNVLDFLAGGKEELTVEFFNSREINHLRDVRAIFSIIISTFFISLVSLILSFIVLFLIIKNKIKILKFFDRTFMVAALAVVSINVILILALSVDFGMSFAIFHKSFFKENSYSFDPLYEKIVVLYPEQLFYDAGIMILKYASIIAWIIILMELIVYALKKFSSRKSVDSK